MNVTALSHARFREEVKLGALLCAGGFILTPLPFMWIPNHLAFPVTRLARH
jgi:hypothetical protein